MDQAGQTAADHPQPESGGGHKMLAIALADFPRMPSEGIFCHSSPRLSNF